MAALKGGVGAQSEQPIHMLFGNFQAQLTLKAEGGFVIRKDLAEGRPAFLQVEIDNIALQGGADAHAAVFGQHLQKAHATLAVHADKTGEIPVHKRAEHLAAPDPVAYILRVVRRAVVVEDRAFMPAAEYRNSGLIARGQVPPAQIDGLAAVELIVQLKPLGNEGRQKFLVRHEKPGGRTDAPKEPLPRLAVAGGEHVHPALLFKEHHAVVFRVKELRAPSSERLDHSHVQNRLMFQPGKRPVFCLCRHFIRSRNFIM
ncbi:hypothetical protein SDC9_75741 [bioreactor metagenome]|uniref:Uncharacterized protein n=1 Tax=bioreactor metagenome TaxID=1076179 RepID=A0A644YMU0_9ZZZZ